MLQRSGKAPGVGLLHAPFSLLPMSFPRNCWDQALELAPLFNELVDRVSLDGEFLQQTLARLFCFSYELKWLLPRINKLHIKDYLKISSSSVIMDQTSEIFNWT